MAIDKFRYPANVTHSRYGIIIIPAASDILKNRVIVLKISIHRITSQIKEKKYQFRLKKKIDQKKLKISWSPYVIKADPFGFLDVAARYDAIPIRIYRIVHTTGNSHPGGESFGLFIVSNVCIPFRVSSADRIPTPSGMTMQIIRVFHCFFIYIPPLLHL